MWRWDQGRLEYFRFDEIKRIASALREFDGRQLPRGGQPDTLRAVLGVHSDQPFLPESYTVWRNYGRVFGAQLLAAKIGNLLVCTELCSEVAGGEVTCDEYMLHLVNRFYFPAPFFQGYDPLARKVFPFAALIKYLVARAQQDDFSGISVDQVISVLIGNSVSGAEETTRYTELEATPQEVTLQTRRQIRELMIFASQISFLNWSDDSLFFDGAAPKLVAQVDDLVHPFVITSEHDAGREIISLGRYFDPREVRALTTSDTLESAAVEFCEGSKVRVTHLRYERSAKLRDMFFAEKDQPQVCEMCQLDTSVRYPWTEKVIEVHHLLPLSSPIRIGAQGTSLVDVVGLCPTCHRATHRFYGRWLKANRIKDFRSYEEARHVYEQTRDSLG